MRSLTREFSRNILSLNRYSKRSIAIITDICLCVLCTWLAFVLRLEKIILFKEFLYTAAVLIIISIPIFWLCGLYRTIFRYTNLSIILTILQISIGSFFSPFYQFKGRA